MRFFVFKNVLTPKAGSSKGTVQTIDSQLYKHSTMVIKDNLRAQYMVLDWHLINPRQSGFY